MRTSVHIADSLLAEAKRKAAKEGRTLTSLIEEGLRIVVTEPTSERKRAVRRPRISKARGGLLPGVDPIKLSNDIDELEEIERLRRGTSAK
jgi:hypothetical protein